MKKILLTAALILAFAGFSFADTLYTNNFSTSEPPTNWSIFATQSPAEVSATTFTASANVGYVSLTTTTNAGEKSIWWKYDNGASWGPVTTAFTIYDASTNTNTAFEWGIRLPASTTTTANSFKYYSDGTNWNIQPYGFASTTPVLINALQAGDIITTTIGAGFGATVSVKINTFTAFSAASTQSQVWGSIFFGLHRTKYGFSYAKISNLSVTGSAITATATSTFTATPTNTCTDTPTATPTCTATPRRTATGTKTATPTTTPTRTPTFTGTPTATRTITKTVTPTPVRTRTPLFPAGMSNSGW